MMNRPDEEPQDFVQRMLGLAFERQASDLYWIPEAAGWGYAAALRSALRHDVKTFVVGEMRDRDAVAVTLDAALTGHRVITTYHAGDIPSVYSRMLHQGFEPFLVSSAITGVVAQRWEQAPDGKGRSPQADVFLPDDDWKDFIAQRPSLSELRQKLAARTGTPAPR